MGTWEHGNVGHFLCGEIFSTGSFFLRHDETEPAQNPGFFPCEERSQALRQQADRILDFLEGSFPMSASRASGSGLMHHFVFKRCIFGEKNSTFHFCWSHVSGELHPAAL